MLLWRLCSHAGAPADDVDLLFVLAETANSLVLDTRLSTPHLLAPLPLAVMLALLAPPLRCALPLPLPPPFPSATRRPPPLLRIVSLLPRHITVSPLLSALAALAPLLPLPAPALLHPAPAISLGPFATSTVTARPRQDQALPRPRRRWRDGALEAHRALRAPAPTPRAGRVEGAAGAQGAAEGGRAADGLAAHGAVEGDDAVEQRGAAGGGRRGHGVLELGQGLMTVDQLPR